MYETLGAGRRPWRGLPWRKSLAAALCASAWWVSGATAQDKGTLDPQPLPPLAKPESRDTRANQLFARKITPAAMPARAIGFYSKGCVAGGVELPINGETWQVMRVSRHRNWGLPILVQYIERLSERAARSGGPAFSSATCHSRVGGRCSRGMRAIRPGSMSISGSPPCQATS